MLNIQIFHQTKAIQGYDVHNDIYNSKVPIEFQGPPNRNLSKLLTIEPNYKIHSAKLLKQSALQLHGGVFD